LRRAAAVMAGALALGAAMPSASEPAPGVLGFREALRRALSANASVERARAEVGVADAEKRGALSLVMPRLSATGDYVRNSQDVEFGTGDDRRTLLPLNDWNARLTLTQPIFAGLREKRAYDQAREGTSVARLALRGEQDRVLLQVAADYLAVARGDALLEVERQSLELAERRQRQAVDLYEAGETTRVDVLRAETAIKAAQRRLAAARLSRESAAGRLRVALDLEGDFEVVPPERELPPLPPEPVLAEEALQTRPDVETARRDVRIAELEVSKQRGAYLPVVTADAGYVWQKRNFPTDRYGYAALRFSVPIFQGGSVRAKVALARERERQARLQLDEVSRSAREDVRQALLDAEATRTDLELAEEQLQAAQAEYDQLLVLYDNQEATSLDLQASEIGLAEAKRAVATGRLLSVYAELAVWYSAGELKTVLAEELEP